MWLMLAKENVSDKFENVVNNEEPPWSAVTCYRFVIRAP